MDVDVPTWVFLQSSLVQTDLQLKCCVCSRTIDTRSTLLHQEVQQRGRQNRLFFQYYWKLRSQWREVQKKWRDQQLQPAPDTWALGAEAAHLPLHRGYSLRFQRRHQ